MYKDGEPCKHSGCLSHVSHPCEECGRIAGHYPMTMLQKIQIMIEDNEGETDSYGLASDITALIDGLEDSAYDEGRHDGLQEYLNMGKYRIVREVLVELLWELDTSKTSDKVLHHAVIWIIENWLDQKEKK